MSQTFRAHLNCALALIAAAFIMWICLFKVHAPDFWWNVKAGQIIRESGWITVEPFAYTREGAPYLSIHSWLSQIILSFTWDLMGAKGIIALRTALVLLTMGTLLLIDTKRLWPNVFPVLLGTVILKSALLDRPQLFTFLLFSLELFITLKLLNIPEVSAKLRTTYLIKWLALFLVSHILWINLHGGAALLSFGLMGAVFLDHLIELLRERTPLPSLLIPICIRKVINPGTPSSQKTPSTFPLSPLPQKGGEEGEGDSRLLTFSSQFGIKDRTTQLLALGLLGLLIGSLLSPNHIRNVVFIFNLYTDQTAQFILEWQPLADLVYWKKLWPFWIIAVGSYGWSMKKPVACAAILLTVGYMSLSASRHVPLFVIASLGITFYQLKANPQWESLLHKLMQRKFLALAITIVAFLLILIVNEPARSLFARENVSGIGTYEPVKTAYDFIEEANPTGNMFNSYSIGQYLLYRGHPNRKVYVDGRNVEHGYEFLKKTFDAASDPEDWKDIEDRYNLTYAVIDYRPKRNPAAPYPYSHLDANPHWHLVFIDDLIAVYFRDIPEHLDVIENHGYKILTAESFGRQIVFDEVQKDQARELTDELLHQAQEDQRGILSLLLLAKIFIASEIEENALAVLEEAMRRKPLDHRAYELAAQVYDKLGETQKADEMYRKAVKYAR